MPFNLWKDPASLPLWYLWVYRPFNLHIQIDNWSAQRIWNGLLRHSKGRSAISSIIFAWSALPQLTCEAFRLSALDCVGLSRWFIRNSSRIALWAGLNISSRLYADDWHDSLLSHTYDFGLLQLFLDWPVYDGSTFRERFPSSFRSPKKKFRWCGYPIRPSQPACYRRFRGRCWSFQCCPTDSHRLLFADNSVKTTQLREA